MGWKERVLKKMDEEEQSGKKDRQQLLNARIYQLEEIYKRQLRTDAQGEECLGFLNRIGAEKILKGIRKEIWGVGKIKYGIAVPSMGPMFTNDENIYKNICKNNLIQARTRFPVYFEEHNLNKGYAGYTLEASWGKWKTEFSGGDGPGDIEESQYWSGRRMLLALRAEYLDTTKHVLAVASIYANDSHKTSERIIGKYNIDDNNWLTSILDEDNLYRIKFDLPQIDRSTLREK